MGNIPMVDRSLVLYSDVMSKFLRGGEIRGVNTQGLSQGRLKGHLN